eukprot:COSAG06_NODE_12479_length_1375_cov_61.966079_2_plen_48_part_00
MQGALPPMMLTVENVHDIHHDGGKETRLFEPFIYKNAHFTKTGSGQT